MNTPCCISGLLSMTNVPAGTKTVPPAGKMAIAPFPNEGDADGCRGMVADNGRTGFPVGWIGDAMGAIRIGPEVAGGF